MEIIELLLQIFLICAAIVLIPTIAVGLFYGLFILVIYISITLPMRLFEKIISIPGWIRRSITGYFSDRRYKKHQATVNEMRRLRQEIEEKRWSNDCIFPEAISVIDFGSIAVNAGKGIKRVSIYTKGPIVFGKVISRTRISTWNFKISFNDNGRITGRYWIESENYDSPIPGTIGINIYNEVKNRLAE